MTSKILKPTAENLKLAAKLIQRGEFVTFDANNFKTAAKMQLFEA